MRSTFHGLEVGRRSLFAQQAALTTTGHNIANANTKGYSRQVVNLVASRPIEAPGFMSSNAPGQLGTGVEFNSIKRVREGFLDHQFYNENKDFGDWSVRKDTMEKLEAIMNEPTDSGIRQVIESFWNSWQDLSKDPDNLTARSVVKERTLALVEAFNHTSKQLKDLSGDITENINVKATEADSIINQVAALNNEIFRIEGLGNNANDLRDQRDILVDDLSKIMNINVRETESGYQVSMGNTMLVDGISPLVDITSDFLESAADGDLNSGEVYGMIQSRDYYVANYQLQMDSMVKAMVNGDMTITLPKGTVLPAGTVLDGFTYDDTNRVLAADKKVTVKGINGLHQLGFTLQTDSTGAAISGVPFFTVKDGFDEISAESITLNPTIVNNVRYIAASSRTTKEGGIEKVVAGNGDLALYIAGARNQTINFDPEKTGQPILTDGSFDEFFRAVVGQLGVQTQEATRQADNKKVLVEQVDSRRQSVSGVSLDEEMANMIKYQHAYNAAARTITTVDEMLDKIINSMGVVGR